MILLDTTENPIALKNVSLEHIQQASNMTDELKNIIDDMWQKELKLAQDNQKILFDSTVYRFIRYQNYMKGGLKITVDTLSYKLRYIAKKFPEIAEQIGSLQAMFTHILIQTQDGKYIFGRKSNSYVTDLKTCFIGGVFEERGSLESHVLEEIMEELYIDSRDIGQLSIIGMYRNDIGNVGVVIQGATQLTSYAICERFQSNKGGTQPQELSEVIPIAKHDLRVFMKDQLLRYSDVSELINNYLNGQEK